MNGPTTDHPRWLTWHVLLLAGPVIWYLYFWVVYLLAEAGCRRAFPETSVLGMSGVAFVTLLATAITSGSLAYFAFTAYSAARSTPDLIEPTRETSFYALGALLGAFFLVATLFVGVPAAVLDVC